jgi:hypothetical protein
MGRRVDDQYIARLVVGRAQLSASMTPCGIDKVGFAGYENSRAYMTMATINRQPREHGTVDPDWLDLEPGCKSIR